MVNITIINMPDNLEKKALVAMHGALASPLKTRLGTIMSYQITEAQSEKEMLARLKEEDYRVVVMDVNLGRPGARSYGPARAVHDEKGDAIFVGFTGLDQDFVDEVNAAGIPCYRADESNLPAILDVLESA